MQRGGDVYMDNSNTLISAILLMDDGWMTVAMVTRRQVHPSANVMNLTSHRTMRHTYDIIDLAVDNLLFSA